MRVLTQAETHGPRSCPIVPKRVYRVGLAFGTGALFERVRKPRPDLYVWENKLASAEMPNLTAPKSKTGGECDPKVPPECREDRPSSGRSARAHGG